MEKNRDFAREISPDVREKFPAETAEFEDEELVEYLERAVERAQDYGLSTDNELVTFVDLTLAVAEDFDRKGVFREIFEDQTIANDMRLNEVFSRATEEDWLEASGDADDSGE